jgi:Contractile injection system tube protein
MNQPQLAKAEVKIGQDGTPFAVQFNPTTLQVEITNSINQQGESGGTNQVSTQSSAKMGLDLLFDTSGSGEDVRSRTRALRAAVRAPQASEAQGASPSAAAEAGAAFVPPLVTFQWGTFIFSGIAESYRETLDFFSADGVPLRAQVALSLKEQAGEFTALERPNPRGTASPAAFEVPSALGSGGAAGVASRGGDLRAARAIAAANGETSLRFSAGASLALGGGVQLREEVSFAASACAGGGAGAGLSLGGAAGLGAGLQVSAPALRFDAQRLQPAAPARQLATDAGAGFGIDGRALPAASAGLRSDVGAGRALSGRLRFDN